MTAEDTLAAPPLQRFYDLSDLSQAGDEVVIAAGADDLPRLAEWLDVDAVERFEATVTLQRQAVDRFRYEAALVADLVQACVVSLAPVRSHLDLRFSRVLHLKPRSSRRRSEPDEKSTTLTLAAGDDDVPEELDSPRFDLVAPLLEELSLGINPYPRAEGVEFDPQSGGRTPEDSPFAALKRLKPDRR